MRPTLVITRGKKTLYMHGRPKMLNTSSQAVEFYPNRPVHLCKRPKTNSWDEIIKFTWTIQVLHIPCKVCSLTNTDI